MTDTQQPAITVTLDRGLAILEAVVAGAHKLDDIADVTTLSRSVVHRLLSTLSHRGYVRHVAGEGWLVGSRTIELARDAGAQVDPQALVQEAIDDIANIVEDSVHIGVLRDGELLYVAKASGRRMIQMISRVGVRIPAQNTALGRVLNAYTDIDHAVTGFSPELLQTLHSVQTAVEYAKALQQAHAQGYAIDDQESTLGLTCLAVPLLRVDGSTVAALSISAPSVYMTPDRVNELVPLLKERAPGVSRRYDAWIKARGTV